MVSGQAQLTENGMEELGDNRVLGRTGNLDRRIDDASLNTGKLCGRSGSHVLKQL
jgi:hypothetical protein